MGKPKKTDAIAKLDGLIKKAEDLSKLHHDNLEFTKWQRATELALRNIFGEKAKNIDEFTSLIFSPMAISSDSGDEDFQSSYAR